MHFQESGYSSSFNKMIQTRLIAMGEYSGETGHSFRRGSLQATAAAEGVLAAAIKGRIKTPAILDCYFDPHRHLGRVKH